MRVWPDYMGANRGGNVPKVTKAQERRPKKRNGASDTTQETITS